MENYSSGDEGVCQKISHLMWTVHVLRSAFYQEGGAVGPGT